MITHVDIFRDMAGQYRFTGRDAYGANLVSSCEGYDTKTAALYMAAAIFPAATLRDVSPAPVLSDAGTG